MDWLENKFAPALQKVTNYTWIVVIKDSLMQILPFILVGSIFCCLAAQRVKIADPPDQG